MTSRDAAQFDRVYAECFDRVAAYLLARTDRDCAAEVLARTFEVAWRRLGDLPDDPVPWLIGVARNVLSEVRRADTRRRGLLEHLAANASPATTRDVSDVVIDRDVALAALAVLGPAEQDAVLLSAWDGLTDEQAAQVVGCSPGAFAVRRSRARARLRSALGELNVRPAIQETT
jgi:RNA polymerase sigma-70 factor (ECF subfamily)